MMHIRRQKKGIKNKAGTCEKSFDYIKLLSSWRPAAAPIFF